MASTAGMNYTYDGDGRRAKKAAGSPSSADRLYWYGINGEVLAESDWGGTLISEYIYFGGMRIARRDVSTGNVYYFLPDRLGTARVMTNASGTVVEESDFLPFGQERVITDSLNNTYKYTGHERDTESGLDHTLYRQYASTQARWLSADPLRGKVVSPQTWNRYAYVANNPLSYFDPDGRGIVCFGEMDDEICEDDADYWPDPHCPSVYCYPPHQAQARPARGQPDPDRTFRRVRDALDDARRMLRDPECAALFTATNPDYAAPVSALAILQSIEHANSPYGYFAYELLDRPNEPGTIYNAVTRPIFGYEGADQYRANTGIINVAIVINTDPDSPFNNGASERERAITILHELGHLMMFRWGENAVGIVNDRDRPDFSEWNTENVRAACN
jgi:RHS repeat-associated protein